jgi:Protein of unknown function (DUF3467)
MDDTKKFTPPETEGEQLEEIVPVYANNTRFEPTAWDLRIFFGQLMPSGRQKIDWHTDVTIPWVQAKLMHLYLGINLGLYELENGKIKIPPGVLPPEMATLPSGMDPSNARTVDSFEFVQRAIRTFRDAESSDG